ncbi:MAG: glycosyl transferase [Deltaproteobacteria bacterium]|nr:glycosyl transferase [Deltaproteobacteria bacterium]
MNNIYLPFVAFAICLVATPVVRNIAIKKGWVANPTEDRWHSKSTALMGGVAIYIGLAVPLFFVADFASIGAYFFNGATHAARPSIAAVVWLCATFLFAVGLTDDFVEIKPQTKLVAQIMVAAFVAFLDFRLHWFTSLTLDTMVTIFWVVGICNALNLIDNMDGLCAGVALIALLSLSVLFGAPLSEGTWTALTLAGALGAFLVYNFKPASIFMGDSGSLLIGVSLAILTLNYSEYSGSNTLSRMAVPILILMVPIFDTTLVTLIRTLSGRKASIGGRDHSSHRLIMMGFKERGAMLVLCGIGAVSGVSAVFVSRTDTLTSPTVIIPAAISVLLMGIYMAQLRVYPDREFSVLRGHDYSPVLYDITYKKQILLIILDLGMVAFTYYLSYRLRFGSREFNLFFQIFLKSLPAVIACKLAAFFIMGIYRAMWGYMSTSDVFTYLKASTVATMLSVVAVTFVYRFENFSKGIFIVDWLLTTGYLLGSRGSFRLFLDSIKRKSLAGGDRVMIYGAGRGGELLLREILNNRTLNFDPVGFIDDDDNKKGRKLQGYPIFGGFNKAAGLCRKHDVEGLLLACSNGGNPEFINNIRKFCKEKNLFLKCFSVDIVDMD